MIRIIIGGDICPMGRVEKLFIEGTANELFNDLLGEIKNADLSIANLECPLIAEKTPIKKAGPALGASAKCVKGLKTSGLKAINLANNHSFDHGAKGLATTMNALDKEGIPHFGAGKNIEEARKPFKIDIDGHEIVFYSMAEQEFSVASNDSPGSNPFDMINFVYAIKDHKNNNLFIVLLHGGVEHYSYPTPETMRRCRFMIDMGADAVICGHSHCPQPWEIYKGKPIVYGLGNLIFEPFKQLAATWYEGYLAELIIDRKNIQFRPIPYFQSLENAGARKMQGVHYNSFMDKMRKRSALIVQPALLEKEWENYCSQREGEYLTDLYGYSRTMRKFASFLLPVLHPLSSILNSLLLVRNEGHREILDTILRISCKRHASSENPNRGR
jgi:poly-gamma-glutamate capsule biosynthesis protein CapA/YwtB (metallophosphatase superfamily)